MQYEQLGLIGALTLAVGALWQAYVAKSKQVETLLEAVTRTLAIAEKALERTERILERLEALIESRPS